MHPITRTPENLAQGTAAPMAAAWIDVAVALLAALLSVVLQGFDYGVSNNAFHIPFVLRWNELDHFSGDAFYKTLPRFYSGFWWLVRLVANEQNLPLLFFAIHLIGRAATFLSLAWMLRLLSLNLSARSIGLLFLAVTPLLRGPSMFGMHDLFIDFLSHSPLTWPVIVTALCAALGGRWRTAALGAGATFVINAFVGVWLGVALTVLAWAHRRELTRRQVVEACVLFVLCCLPILLWSLEPRDTSAPPLSFAYREFIRTYYPYHFLIESIPLPQILNVLGLWACLWLTCSRMAWWDWRRILAAYVGLVISLGALVYIFDSRMLFNLHGLRAEGVVEFLAIPLLASAAMLMLERRTPDDRLWAGIIFLSLLTGSFVSASLGLSIASLRAWPALADKPRIRGAVILASLSAIALLFQVLAAPVGNGIQGLHLACLATVLAALAAGHDGLNAGRWVALRWGATLLSLALIWCGPGLRLFVVPVVLIVLLSIEPRLREGLEHSKGAFGLQGMVHTAVVWPVVALTLLQLFGSVKEMRANITAKAHPSALTRDWVDLTTWVRVHPVTGVVLVPVEVPEGVHALGTFQLDARTPVWVDWKQGAAVMWAPSFYAIWSRRFAEVLALRTPEAFRNYARSNGIPLFVAQHSADQPPCPGGSVAIYGNASFAICRVE